MAGYDRNSFSAVTISIGIVILIYFFLYYFFVDEMGAVTYSVILTGLVVWLYRPYIDKGLKNIFNPKTISSVVVFFVVSLLLVSSKLNGEHIRVLLDSILLTVMFIFVRRVVRKKKRD